ncbi:MAG: DUF4861 family protein, partial [Ekhidna sp.]|nr:DUF4861 family protein [Ekhidna sp.]
LVTGIVTLKDPEIKQYQGSQFVAHYTHGKQSENKDGLGMAIITPQENFVSSVDAPTEGKGVVSTRMILLKSAEGSYTYYFTCDWEGQDGSYKDISPFEASLRKQIEEISQSTVF